MAIEEVEEEGAEEGAPSPAATSAAAPRTGITTLAVA